MELKPGYKQTEVGVIPEDWEVKPLDKMCTAILDCHHSTPVWTKSGALVIRNQNIRDGKLDLSVPSFTDEKHFLERTQRAIPSFGDLIITREAPMGLVCMIPDGLKCCLGQRMVLLRIDQNSTELRYVLYALLGEAVQRFISIAGGTGSTVSNLRIPVLRELQIVVPEKSEQEAIAEALSDADALIESLEQLITKKRQIKQGAMQELLTGKKRMPDFSGEWEVTSLGEISIVTKGSQLHNSESTQDGKYPHLNGGIAPSGYAEKSNMPANTIAISEGGNSCGYVQLMTVPYWCGGHCYSIISKCINNGFLYHALKSQQTALMGLRVGSGLPNVQKTALLSFKLCYPSNWAEQKAIAMILTDMDAEINELETKLAKARQLKQGMMDNLLTGKIRLL